MRDRARLEEFARRSGELRAWGYRLLCGVDEVGRGALAGPVAAGAVLLAGDLDLPGLDDSKRLSRAARERLHPEIRRRALASAVAFASAREVDRLGIVRATQRAMRRALGRLRVAPEHLLLDAFLLPQAPWPQIARIRGDHLFQEVAAASIIAKVERDALMARLAADYPAYGWERNMGYGARAHREAIARLGLTPWHRESFCRQIARSGSA